MTSPQEFKEQHRRRIYTVTALSVTLVMAIAAITNFVGGNIVSAIMLCVLAGVFALTVFFARGEKRIDVLSNIVAYLLGGAIVFNLLSIPLPDVGPYAGVFAVLTLASLLIDKRIQFVTFAFLFLTGYSAVAFSGNTEVPMDAHMRLLLIYIVVVVLLSLHKKYFYSQEKELFDMANETHKEGVAAQKRADISDEVAKELKEQKQALEEKNKELEVSRSELEELNQIMTGRELKMTELKGEVTELKQQIAELRAEISALKK